MISLETPQWKRASSRLEGRTAWILPSCGRCSRLTTGTSWTRFGDLSKGQSPCELLEGLSLFHSRRCQGLRPCVESGPEPEDSSPGLTCILRCFWSLPREVSPRLEWGHARALSSRAVAAVSRFPSRGSRDLWLSLEAFRRGFPTGLSHVPPRSSPLPPRSSPCKSKQCRENRILWNGLRHLGDSWNGGTTHEFLSPFLCSAPPLEMRRKRRKFFPEEAEKYPSSRAWRRKQSSSGGGRTLVLPLEWRRVCRGTS